MTQPIVLSIAGSDNTGGAGIQADIKTCCAFGVYAATVITGVTAQNSYGVYGVESVSANLLDAQIDSVYDAMTPGAVKTGMLPSPEIIRQVADKLIEYNVKNIIVDPVMIATNGGVLVPPDNATFEAFKERLFPLATLITPNLHEASSLINQDIREIEARTACEMILDVTDVKAVLLKGGHSESDEYSIDYYYDGEIFKEFRTEKIDTLNTHGTGCTLSSAIACGLAKGDDILTAVDNAKSFIYRAIKSAKHLNITDGAGPLDFFV